MRVKKLSSYGGVSLLEMLLVIALSSVMIISITSALLALAQQRLAIERQQRLVEVLWQILRGVEKDLRRAGFGLIKQTNNTIILSAHSGAVANSCLIVAYDLNRNDRMDATTKRQSDWFGYRFHQQSIEHQRGVTDCNGSGWEKLVDPAEIVILHFSVNWHANRATTELPNTDQLMPTNSKGYFIIRLTAHWRRQPAQNEHIVSYVKKMNP